MANPKIKLDLLSGHGGVVKAAIQRLSAPEKALVKEGLKPNLPQFKSKMIVEIVIGLPNEPLIAEHAVDERLYYAGLQACQDARDKISGDLANALKVIELCMTGVVKILDDYEKNNCAIEEVGRKQIMDEFKELERQKDVCREILNKADPDTRDAVNKAFEAQWSKEYKNLKDIGKYGIKTAYKIGSALGSTGAAAAGVAFAAINPAKWVALVKSVIKLGTEIWKAAETFHMSHQRLMKMWGDLQKEFRALKADIEKEKSGQMGSVARAKHRMKAYKFLSNDKPIKAVIAQAKDTQAKLSIVRKSADREYEQIVKLIAENTQVERLAAAQPNAAEVVFSQMNAEINDMLDHVMKLQGSCVVHQKVLDAQLKEIQRVYIEIQKMQKEYKKQETTHKDLEKWHKTVGKKLDDMESELEKSEPMVKTAKSINQTSGMDRLMKVYG